LKSETYTFKSPALFEVISGSGFPNAGDHLQNIETGTVLPLPAGTAFTIQNQSDLPIAIKVQILGPSYPLEGTILKVCFSQIPN